MKILHLFQQKASATPLPSKTQESSGLDPLPRSGRKEFFNKCALQLCVKASCHVNVQGPHRVFPVGLPYELGAVTARLLSNVHRGHRAQRIANRLCSSNEQRLP